MRLALVVLPVVALLCTAAAPTAPTEPAAPKEPTTPALPEAAPAVPAAVPVSSKKFDLDTDAGLKKALAELVGLTDNPMQCVRRPDELPDVVLVGAFVDDVGCVSRGYFGGGFYVPERTQAGRALAALGWSDVKRRPDLARVWVDHALFDSALLTNAKIGEEVLPAPTATAVKNTVVIEGWRQLRQGMRPGRAWAHVKVTFSAAGDATIEELETKRE